MAGEASGILRPDRRGNREYVRSTGSVAKLAIVQGDVAGRIARPIMAREPRRPLMPAQGAGDSAL